ncbi:retropepsin-like aspartic protease family protein [Aliikangiella sp. IMCC44653]
MAIIRAIIFVIGTFVSLNLVAEEEIQVTALFKNAAMVKLNGNQKLVRVGQNLSPVIKLIKADSHSATFLVNGKPLQLKLKQLGAFSASNSSQQAAPTAVVSRAQTGMYFTSGLINGVATQFLVDTGASHVAMNESTAQSIGLNYRQNGVPSIVLTASGRARAWEVVLNQVNVGGIQLSQVSGMVIQGAGPDQVLLGMSFLSRVKMENKGETLHLSKIF